MSKLASGDFVQYLKQFDIVCWTETSGGTIILIRKSTVDSFRNIPVVYDNVLAFKVSRNLLGRDKDLIMLCAYLPPMGSPAYILTSYDNGIGMLERCMLDIFEM